MQTIRLYLDSHVDTLSRLLRFASKNYDFQHRPELRVDIGRLSIGKVNACFFALWAPQINEDLFRTMTLFQHRNFCRIIATNSNSLYFSKSPENIISTIHNNKISISLGLENGFPIRDIEALHFYHTIGVQYITLCHNKNNHICDSATDTPLHKGVSKFGHALIEEMNKLGIMVDISHLSNASVEAVLQTSKNPIIASHSGAYSICKNERNLNDTLLKGIAANKGIIQVTMLPKCVGQSLDVPSFVNHIDYIRDLIGIEYIGIGSDFDGGGGILGCEDMSQMGNIITELQKRGYTDSDINKILGLNFIRVYEQNHTKEGKQ